MKLCFHGTRKENVKSILEIGFNVGTYFAYHLEDAIEFGGEYIFMVEFDETKFNNIDDDSWQFWIRVKITPDKIRRLTKYKVRKIAI